MRTLLVALTFLVGCAARPELETFGDAPTKVALSVCRVQELHPTFLDGKREHELYVEARFISGADLPSILSLDERKTWLWAAPAWFASGDARDGMFIGNQDHGWFVRRGPTRAFEPTDNGCFVAACCHRVDANFVHVELEACYVRDGIVEKQALTQLDVRCNIARPVHVPLVPTAR